MKSEESKPASVDRIDKDAAYWCAKSIGGFSAKEQDAFFEWLAADPTHSEWFAKHQKTWKRLDLIAQWIPECSDKPNMDLLKYKKVPVLRNTICGLAAALAVGFPIFFATTSYFEHSGKSDQNIVAETYTFHELPDGSAIELNRGAELQVNYTADVRRVELVSNEAHFDVAKDASRPFVVSVRGLEVRAIGTAFNVRLHNEAVEVIVTKGRVKLAAKKASADSSGEKVAFLPDDLESSELEAGQMTEVRVLPEGLSGEVKDVSLLEINRRLSWKPQMFVFEGTPLAEVVREFNSRNRSKIVIADAGLEQIPIMASFRSTSTEHFVELLKLSIELRVERKSDERIVLYSGD